jgi:hypothetical protein
MNPLMLQPTDEYSAHSTEVEGALAEEEIYEGRPYEIRAARTGLFAELRADKPGMLSALFLVIVLIAAFGAPWLAPMVPWRATPRRRTSHRSGTAARGPTSSAPTRRATTSCPG